MKFKNLLKVLILSSLIVFTACNSGGTDGEASPTNDRFVPDANNSGRIDLKITEDRLPTSEVTGFKVYVRDKDGQGVPNMRVTCDSELGIAVVEPSTGSFLTDDNGETSGRFGCDRPGSFRVGCRLNSGVNERVFKTIICEGPRPAGFVGFPGAGGGGMGGGSSDFDFDDDFLVRVTGVSIDEVASNVSYIDTFRDICDPDGVAGSGDEVPEPFRDTLVKFTVENNSDKLVRFNGYFFTISNYDGNGNSATSDFLNFVGETAVSANGGTTLISQLFLESLGSQRTVPASNIVIPVSGQSFKNVRFTLVGEDSAGNEIRLTVRQSFGMGNYDNCG